MVAAPGLFTPGRDLLRPRFPDVRCRRWIAKWKVRSSVRLVEAEVPSASDALVSSNPALLQLRVEVSFFSKRTVTYHSHRESGEDFKDQKGRDSELTHDL
jgi:hypothetical protein